MSDEPAVQMRSAAPPVIYRLAAFVSVLIGGVCGALIGYGFTDLQCDGDCGNWLGAGTVIGAVAGAGGVAIVAVLALRAMDEWDSMSAKKAQR